jgi:uncharacterized glyoxalase superfamily protein PhnB
MATKAAKPVPEERRSILFNLVVRDCARAIDWYKRALGAEELMRIAPTGTAIWHAELRVGDTVFYLNDEMPGMGAKAPGGADAPAQAVSMWVGADDCDAAYRRAVDAGAKGTMEPADMFWGDRVAAIRDPFGFDWSFATRVKEMTVDEMRRAGEEFARQMAAQRGG